MNHALTWMGHRWFGPAAVALAALLGPVLANQSPGRGGCAPRCSWSSGFRMARWTTSRTTTPWDGMPKPPPGALWRPTWQAWPRLRRRSCGHRSWRLGRFWCWPHGILAKATSKCAPPNGWTACAVALGALILGTLLDLQSGAASHVMSMWMDDSGSVDPPHHRGGLAHVEAAVDRDGLHGLAAQPEGRTMSTRLLREAAWVVAMWALAQSGELPGPSPRTSVWGTPPIHGGANSSTTRA